MKIISYKKTDDGPVIVGARDIDFNQKPSTTIERFEAFFHDVPLWGGQEWKTLSVDEIVPIFQEAVVDILQVYQQRHDAAIQEHSSHSRFVRWWKELRGWKAPYIPSRDEVVQDMAARCRRLADWMRANNSRPFFAGFDMSHLTHKPEAVAARLVAA